MSWSGSDVPHLILQGLALRNDIGPTPAQTGAVKLANMSLLHTHTHTHTHTTMIMQHHSAVCLQLNTVLWLKGATEYHFTVVNVQRLPSITGGKKKKKTGKSSQTEVKCDAVLV